MSDTDDRSDSDVQGDAIAREEAARSDLYGFLAALLVGPPDAQVLGAVRNIQVDESALGTAVSSLIRIARDMTPEQVSREFHDLFIGLGRGELLPYASYYLTGFLHEKPLAKLRDDMRRYGLRPADGRSEPEDHIASLCEMMAAMIDGRFGTPSDLATQQAFFSAHLAPWGEHFFSDLEAAQHSVFYAPVGTIGRTFFEVEREAFRMQGEMAAG